MAWWHPTPPSDDNYECSCEPPESQRCTPFSLFPNPLWFSDIMDLMETKPNCLKAQAHCVSYLAHLLPYNNTNMPDCVYKKRFDAVVAKSMPKLIDCWWSQLVIVNILSRRSTDFQYPERVLNSFLQTMMKYPSFTVNPERYSGLLLGLIRMCYDKELGSTTPLMSSADVVNIADTFTDALEFPDFPMDPLFALLDYLSKFYTSVITLKIRNTLATCATVQEKQHMYELVLKRIQTRTKNPIIQKPEGPERSSKRQKIIP